MYKQNIRQIEKNTDEYEDAENNEEKNEEV